MPATALWDSQDPRSKRWMNYSAEHNAMLEAAFQHPNKPDVDIDLGGNSFTVSVKSMTQTNAKGFGRPVRRSDPSRLPVCKYFAAGNCKSGDNCPYPHSGGTPVTSGGGAAKPTTDSDSALQKLLGSDKLVSKTGEVDTATIEGKTLLIYFSAHWCPPCRGFTPKLAQFYKQLKDSGLDDFEVVFASSDQSEEEFNDYFKEAHGDWLALPYAARGAKTALSKHFKVEGIPTLVVVDAAGKTKTTDGRAMVGEETGGGLSCSDFVTLVGSDPEGKKFQPTKTNQTTPGTSGGGAAKPTTDSDSALQKLLGSDKLVSKTGVVDTATIEGKTLLIYFSAHWCPPCRGFTPKLAQFYKQLKDNGRGDFEVVFASSDQSEEEFTDYFKEAHGDWLALPYAARGAKAALSKHFKVEGIPTLVVVDAAGKTITTDGRAMVGSLSWSDFVTKVGAKRV